MLHHLNLSKFGLNFCYICPWWSLCFKFLFWINQSAIYIKKATFEISKKGVQWSAILRWYQSLNPHLTSRFCRVQLGPTLNSKSLEPPTNMNFGTINHWFNRRVYIFKLSSDFKVELSKGHEIIRPVLGI
jgi:hypothetical protein